MERLAIAMSYVENRTMVSPTEAGPQTMRDAADIASHYARLARQPGHTEKWSVVKARRLATTIPPDVAKVLRDGGLLVEMLLALPHGVYDGANRYDTDDEVVLHLWRAGQS